LVTSKLFIIIAGNKCDETSMIVANATNPQIGGELGEAKHV